MLFFRQTLSRSLLKITKLKCKKVFSNEFKCLTAASYDVYDITVSKKIHTKQQFLKVKFFRLFTHVESVSFKSSKYEKKRKILHGLTRNKQKCIIEMLRKGNRLVTFPEWLVFSRSMLSIVC